MPWIGRLRNFFTRRELERGIDDELNFHIAERVDELIQEGLTPTEARRRALIQFGGYAQHKERISEIDLFSQFEVIAGDLRFGVRKLVASPAFTLAAIISLALGIGANMSIFNIINALMLRSLPVADPSALVEVDFEQSGSSFTNPIWEQLRDNHSPFAGTAAWSADRFDLARGGVSQFANSLWVSGEFFRLLGVPALQGRVFTSQQDQRGTEPVAVISYGFWRRHFPNDSRVVGKTIYLNRHAFQIVGITPPWFTGLAVDKTFDVAIPISCEPILHTDSSWLDARSTWWLTIIARLQPGQGLGEAETQLRTRAPAVFRATVPLEWKLDDQKEYQKYSFRLNRASVGFSDVRDHYKIALLTLMTTAALLLLITCVNLANLLLARAAARQRELAVRLALGASRMRIVRQLLTESLLLSVAGAVLGFLLSIAASRLLVRLISTTGDPVTVDLSPDFHLLAFAIGAALLTTLLFALAPALRATSGDLNPALKENARGTVEGSSRFHLGKTLIAGQIALSLMLLVAAGLFLGTLKNLLSTDLGFNKQGVLLVSAQFQENSLPKEQRVSITDQIVKRLRSIPGVASASSSIRTPISNYGWNDRIYPEGYRAKSRLDTVVWLNRVSPAYFSTVKSPVLAGRDFKDSDNASAPKVMIIDANAARRYFGSANPIGKTIAMDPSSGLGERVGFQVIGLVKDTKYRRIDEEVQPAAFVASGQDTDPSSHINFEVRSQLLGLALTDKVRSAIMHVNPNVSLEFRDLETQVNESVMQPRVVALLSSIFGLIGLLLAAVGLYGVTAYSVSRRRNEFGIRIALGAGRGSVIRLALNDIGILLAVGILAGSAGALVLSRFIKSLLYGVSPNDPSHLVIAAAVLASCALLAAFLPARRAASLDPLAALREE